MLKKTRSGADKVKVTFVLPPQPEAGHVHVVGDFNDWQAETPMKRDKEGRWRATVELDSGREYEFRYLVNGNYWINDEAADRYVPNGFGTDNCVLATPEPAAAGSARRLAEGEDADATSRSRGRRSAEGDGARRASGGRSSGKAEGGAKGGGGKPRGRSSGGRPSRGDGE
ncbi:MAG TPA: isoamylase early set domain-containing protein [Longimicrobiales bacterium]